jgi:hypothetical protein
VEFIMQIILETEHVGLGDHDYAVVDLTPALVSLIRRRTELARVAGRLDDAVCELSFWGGTAEFYDSSLIEACQYALSAGVDDADAVATDWLANLEEHGHALLPADVDLGALETQRTECDQMILRCSPLSQPPRFEVAWCALLKHTDVQVTTRDLPLTSYFQPTTEAST